MDAHDLDTALREVLEAAGSDAGSFEDAWRFFDELCRESDLLQDQPALVAEAVLGRSPDTTVLKAVLSSVSDDKQGSKTRRAIFKWLLALLQELEPAKLQLYAPAVFDTVMLRVKASAKAEDVATKVAGLELASFILQAEVAGQLPAHLTADDALGRATQLQRVCLSSDVRTSKTLKPAFLGLNGLLLQLSALPQQQQAEQQGSQPAAAAAASSSAEQRQQQLKWLLQLCEQELGGSRVGPGARLAFDAGQANEGAIQGLTAVLSMTPPDEAAGSTVDLLSAALGLAAALLQELAAAITGAASDPSRRPRMYGKFTAAMQLLEQLGPSMAAAGLLRPADLGTAGSAAPAAAPAGGERSLGLLRSLMVVAAGSPNAGVKRAAAAALASLSELMCGELLKLDAGCPAALTWLDAGIGLCSAELAGGGAGAAAAAAAAGPGSGWTRGALEVLGLLTPAVARHQGLKVCHRPPSSPASWPAGCRAVMLSSACFV